MDFETLAQGPIVVELRGIWQIFCREPDFFTAEEVEFVPAGLCFFENADRKGVDDLVRDDKGLAAVEIEGGFEGIVPAMFFCETFLLAGAEDG